MLFNNHSLSLTSDRTKLLSGGSAVFRARALLSLTKPNQHFDDRQICEPFGDIRIGNTSNSILNNFKIYPNPAINKVTLELNSELYENAQFLMFNTAGQRVLEKHLLSNQKIFTFDISDIKPGVYQYQLITKNKNFTNGKLVIIR